MNIYLAGSLSNPNIPLIGERLRQEGFVVYDDWFAAGVNADVEWREYELKRGHSYKQALNGWHAHHVFKDDLQHMQEADALVMVMPSGKSSWVELGWAVGSGRKGYILVGDSEKWDIMAMFAHGVFDKMDDLVDRLRMDFPASSVGEVHYPRIVGG